MTLTEFKAWFEGFSEVMDGPPTEKQWDRIKARVSEIDSKPISYPVYVDRYLTPYRPYWNSFGASGNMGISTLGQNTCMSHASTAAVSPDDLQNAGRAEYSAMLAS